MMRRARWILLVGIVAGVGAWGYFQAQGRGSVPKYRTAAVERGPLTVAISATGTVNAVITVQVGSQVSGQIKELLADFNTRVERGQVIARLDPELFQARVDQALADLESSRGTVINQVAQLERARADVDNAEAALAEGKANTLKARVTAIDSKRDLDRKTQLANRELIARSDLDTSQATYDSPVAFVDASRAKEQSLTAAIRSAEAQRRVAEAMLQTARAQVKQKEAALQQARVDLKNATIRAPIDGVVVARSVDVGQTVAASLQAPTLFTIAQDLSRMQVETSVPEADIGRIKVGDAVSFTVDAFANASFNGRVTQIRQAAQNVQNVITYTVVVDVANPGGKLLPGMTANVKVVVAEKNNVLKVSNAALRFRPSEADSSAASPPTAADKPDGKAPASAGAAPAGESTRDRLARQLGLTVAQAASIDSILTQNREQRRVLREASLSAADRKTRTRELRDQTRAEIRQVLTPEQRDRYDALAAESAGGEDTASTGRVWILGPDGRPVPITLSLGLSDGSATEVRQGDLTEGQHVLVGGTSPTSGRPTGGSKNVPNVRL